MSANSSATSTRRRLLGGLLSMPLLPLAKAQAAVPAAPPALAIAGFGALPPVATVNLGGYVTVESQGHTFCIPIFPG